MTRTAVLTDAVRPITATVAALAVAALVLVTMMFGPVSAAAAPVTVIPTPPAGATPVTFNYTGAVQQYSVPSGIGWVQLKVVGGAGGMNSSFDGGSDGAEVDGTIAVAANDTLLVSVAGVGGVSNGGWTNGGPGGWGGLGAVGGDGNSSSNDLRNGGAGGGASTVQLTSSGGTATVIIAGGGGGMGGASGDPDHTGDGGSAGDGGWTGRGGDHGTVGPLGGSGGSAASAPTSAGEEGKGGSGEGGNGGSGGGGLVGGGAGGGAEAASAGGGGGAGSSWASSAVLGATVKPSGLHWVKPVVNPFQAVPYGTIVITPIPLLTTSMQLAVEHPQVVTAANAGPLTAVPATVDGYVPTGTVQFLDVTNGTGPNATNLGTASLSGGVAAISTLTYNQPGLYQVQAVWTGDNNYATETSPTVQVTVTAARQAKAPTDAPSPHPRTATRTQPNPSQPTTEPTTQPATQPTTQLAVTGTPDVHRELLIAIGLITAGGAVLLASRRRRPHH